MQKGPAMRKPYPSRPSSLLVGLILIAAGPCVSWVVSTTDMQLMAAPPDGNGVTLYDPDPKHLWNRFHQALHIRFRDGDGDRDGPVSANQKFDPNDLDPFFWDRHHPYLLNGPGHREALTLLDEFLDKKGEGLVKEPLKRALLQRDLWALFDWAADPDWPKLDEKKRFVKERGELQSRMGRVIPRLALSAAEIDQLPDNYAAAVKARRYPAEFQADRKSAPFLPADLRDPKGPWVLLGDREGGILAGQHIQFFGGRSTFMVFLRLPEGRDQTLKYVDQFSEWLQKGAKGGPATVPQFSANTQFALVRRALLLYDRGEIRPTRLTEQVQLHILHDPTTAPDGKPDVHTFLEFRLHREQLLAGKAGGLGAVPDDEEEWQHLTFYGGGPLPDGFAVVLPIMRSCRGCHSHGPGVLSINSFQNRNSGWRVTSPGDEERRISAWKREQDSWKLLEGLRKSVPSLAPHGFNHEGHEGHEAISREAARPPDG